MSASKQFLIAALSSNEPSYQKAAALGPSILPVLEELAQGDDSRIAARAVCLAGKIQDSGAIRVLEVAMRQRVPEVRVAVADSARQLAIPGLEAIVLQLMDDPDPGVRRVAAQAVLTHPSPALTTKLHALAANEPNLALRAILQRVESRLQMAH